MATFEDFKLRYPELVACGDANQDAIELFLQEAEDLLNLARCPKLADALQMSFAAHEIAKTGNNPTSSPDQAPGIITSESVGGVSFSYQVSQSRGDLTDYLKSTPYGQQHLRYLRLCHGTGAMVAP